MNERIRELCIKSGAYEHYEVNEGVDGDELPMQKFAELIIQECVEQIQICSEQIKNDDGYADDNIWPIMQSIVDAVAIDVKEHFGVK